uniref:Cytochrome P450 family 2 subfamily B member 6 n=1 Tax=Vombatus ursinus TaxID=29139 RepID=A0A4X2K4C2_VOMUR
VMCGPEAVKEAVVKNVKVFCGHGILAISDSVFQGYGFFSSGRQQHWSTPHRFSITTLRDLGMGKKSVKENIKTEAQCLVEELRKSQEIDWIIGKNHSPELQDRAKMPYTDAVIHEIQRLSDLLPLGIPHMVTEGTFFPSPSPSHSHQGTDVFLFLSSSLKNPHHFEKPHIFDPNHFLDAQGALKKNEAFIPFSMGKCICLGESIARSELFIFLTTILQNVSLVSSKPPEDLDIRPQESGLGTVLQNYELHFLPC